MDAERPKYNKCGMGSPPRHRSCYLHVAPALTTQHTFLKSPPQFSGRCTYNLIYLKYPVKVIQEPMCCMCLSIFGWTNLQFFLKFRQFNRKRTSYPFYIFQRIILFFLDFCWYRKENSQICFVLWHFACICPVIRFQVRVNLSGYRLRNILGFQCMICYASTGCGRCAYELTGKNLWSSIFMPEVCTIYMDGIIRYLAQDNLDKRTSIQIIVILLFSVLDILDFPRQSSILFFYICLFS